MASPARSKCRPGFRVRQQILAHVKFLGEPVIIQHVEGGTWPSWIGTDQKRTINSFARDEQTWTTITSFGGTANFDGGT
ncbi:hypothetical protein HAP47_0002905 [Bradyrhizobium sp. 41S5]|uniref:hypothetical protein n=1 Tax=Bradyrhizobium sp. 41S5 TaxID=1404443 RepID=UPI001E550081|nr:hypothetical protein [Bradyrhizobium sp. 41S5]UFX45694.1 hypothetical protein HAP47_0002905 [Bradyrhizobium sp. 41S5]